MNKHYDMYVRMKYCPANPVIFLSDAALLVKLITTCSDALKIIRGLCNNNN